MWAVNGTSHPADRAVLYAEEHQLQVHSLDKYPHFSAAKLNDICSHWTRFLGS